MRKNNFELNRDKWFSGALATDGFIYCIPSCANQVFTIDRLGEFSLATKATMEEHPKELGFLFRINVKDNNTDTDPDTASKRTTFDCAVTKFFGMQKLFEIVQKCLPPANEVCVVCGCGLYPFMISASSYKESPLSVIYFLLRQVRFLINCKSNSAVGITNLKQKRKSYI